VADEGVQPGDGDPVTTADPCRAGHTYTYGTRPDPVIFAQWLKDHADHVPEIDWPREHDPSLVQPGNRYGCGCWECEP
jgi:hypothetical protein